jgi:2-amino-4-hydroxy-6-hydroxymethyldihydropteridine diphosphokinase
MNLVIISIGSNLGDRLENLREAVKLIKNIGASEVCCSAVYESTAVGYDSENKFYNAVVSFYVDFDVFELLMLVQKIEQDMGRIRLSKSYMDRIIDLDIISFENLTINTQVLTLPHPRYQKRLFVLLPLKDIENYSPGLDVFVYIDKHIEECPSDGDVLKTEYSICV